MKSRKTKRLFLTAWVLALFPLCLTLNSCSSTQRITQEEPPQPVLDSRPAKLKTVEDLACDEFLRVAGIAYDEVIFRPILPMEEILVRALQKGFRPEPRLQIRNGKKSCDMLQVIKPFVKDYLESIASDADPFIATLELSLSLFVQSLEHHSSYYPPSSVRRIFQPAKGAGLMFHTRSDYFIGRKELESPELKRSILGRQPQYLFVKSYFGPQNRFDPESKEGIPLGSKILKIGSHPVSSMSFSEAVALINGGQNPDGTLVQEDEIEVVFEPPEYFRNLFEDIPETKMLRLGVNQDPWLTLEWTDSKREVAYIRIPSFNSPSTEIEFIEKWLGFLETSIDTEISLPKILILDLRNNTGGLVDQAKAIAEAFLPIDSLYMNELLTQSESEETPSTISRGRKLFLGPPQRTEKEPLIKAALIVLVDRLTASASEIFSMAVKDHGVGMIIGEPTMGKGVAQSIRPVSNFLGGRLKLTDRYWYSPRGASLQATSKTENAGLALDIQLTDPVSEYQSSLHPDYSVRIDELLKKTQTNSSLPPIAPNPGPCPICPGFEKSSDAEFSSERIMELRSRVQARLLENEEEEPMDCRTLPGQPHFREESDCLRSWATLYATELLELLKD